MFGNLLLPLGGTEHISFVSIDLKSRNGVASPSLRHTPSADGASPSDAGTLALTLDNGTHCRFFIGGARRARTDGYVPVYACGADSTAPVLGEAGSHNDPTNRSKPLWAVTFEQPGFDRSAIGYHRLARGELKGGVGAPFRPGGYWFRRLRSSAVRERSAAISRATSRVLAVKLLPELALCDTSRSKNATGEAPWPSKGNSDRQGPV